MVWNRLADQGPRWMLLACVCALGCGTTRLTDTQRTATEQVLISNAIDDAVSQIDFTPLAGKKVYFDHQYLEGSVDRGYLVSTLRQHLLASGCYLQEERGSAHFVVEARAGAVGTDRHSLLVGVPAMNVPAMVPGQPSQIPEIPFAKKTKQSGVAKLAVFAYNRGTGTPVMQSGLTQSDATAKDVWFLGAGPFRSGSIRKNTDFAGMALPTFEGEHDGTQKPPTTVLVTQPVTWPENLNPKQPGYLMVKPQDVDPKVIRTEFEDKDTEEKPIEVEPPPAPPPAPAESSLKIFSTPPVSQNSGGHAETEPCQLFGSGWTDPPDS